MAVQIGQPVRCPRCHNAFVATLPGFGGPAAQRGKPFSFPCLQCSSRLEAFTSMVGQRGQCPTCGVEFVIPAPYGSSQRLGGTAPELEYAQPVHAYAAAGAKAPRIIRQPEGAKSIQCPRCHTLNEVTRNNCKQCAMPFTLEGAESSASESASGLATASLVLGIVGLPLSCTVVLPVLAVIFGGLAMRGQTVGGKNPSQRSAVAGLILGLLGLVLFAVIIGSKMI